jgi:hypothetical protein
MYSHELKAFIKAYINHITKTKFFITFKATHFNTITSKNVKASFQGASLVLYDP